MKHTELNEKFYVSPEIAVESIAPEKGFAESGGFGTTDLSHDPEDGVWD